MGNIAPSQKYVDQRWATNGKTSESVFNFSESISYKQKLALVIGIDNYQDYSSNDCVNNATDLSKYLQDLNFNVTLTVNCNLRDFYQIIDTFTMKIQENDLVLFYFSGFGRSINNNNYLLTSDYHFKQGDYERLFIGDNAVKMTYILKNFSDRKYAAMIYLLDCNRTTYLPNIIDFNQNLVPIEPPVQTIFAYSYALDLTYLNETQTNRNSIFLEILLKYIQMPDKDIAELLKLIASDLSSQTNGYQKLFKSNCLTKRLILFTSEEKKKQIMKKIETDINLCSKPSKESIYMNNFQFILIDLSIYLNELTSNMLEALKTLTAKCPCIIEYEFTNDFDMYLEKPTYFFISSRFAAKMQEKLKCFEEVFILEYDKNKADYTRHFDNDIDFIFELADQIFRCYKHEGEEKIKSKNFKEAETKKQLADQVYSTLKSVYNEHFDKTPANHEPLETTVKIFWLTNKIPDEYERLKIDIAIEFYENEDDCMEKIIEIEHSTTVFLVISTDFDVSVGSKFKNIGCVYYEKTFDNYNDIFLKLVTDLCLYYDHLGSTYSRQKNPKLAKTMFILMSTIPNIHFNDNIYEHVTFRVLLLYQLIEGETAPVLDLPDAQFMNYVQPFDNLQNCQDYMITNYQNQFTLYIFEANLLQLDVRSIPSNVQIIQVFCTTTDNISYTNQQLVRHVKRNFNIRPYAISVRELNNHLLISGLEFERHFRRQFTHDSTRINQLNGNFSADCFTYLRMNMQQRINIEDEEIQIGEEAQK